MRRPDGNQRGTWWEAGGQVASPSVGSCCMPRAPAIQRLWLPFGRVWGSSAELPRLWTRRGPGAACPRCVRRGSVAPGTPVDGFWAAIRLNGVLAGAALPVVHGLLHHLALLVAAGLRARRAWRARRPLLPRLLDALLGHEALLVLAGSHYHWHDHHLLLLAPELRHRPHAPHWHGHGLPWLLSHHCLLREDHLLRLALWRHAALRPLWARGAAPRRRVHLLVHLRRRAPWRRVCYDKAALHHLWRSPAGAHGAHGRCLVGRRGPLLPSACWYGATGPRDGAHERGARRVRLAQHLVVRGTLCIWPVGRPTVRRRALGPLEEGLQDLPQLFPEEVRVLLGDRELQGSARWLHGRLHWLAAAAPASAAATAARRELARLGVERERLGLGVEGELLRPGLVARALRVAPLRAAVRLPRVHHEALRPDPRAVRLALGPRLAGGHRGGALEVGVGVASCLPLLRLLQLPLLGLLLLLDDREGLLELRLQVAAALRQPRGVPCLRLRVVDPGVPRAVVGLRQCRLQVQCINSFHLRNHPTPVPQIAGQAREGVVLPEVPPLGQHRHRGSCCCHSRGVGAPLLLPAVGGGALGPAAALDGAEACLLVLLFALDPALDLRGHLATLYLPRNPLGPLPLLARYGVPVELGRVELLVVRARDAVQLLVCLELVPLWVGG
mmetsp:Transcript_45068/g.143574  ORF Transcript_45068/g.143574 Transcript_45068/m.143574 type:complete len:670 (-) Transcript_45068:568-2577(-)